MKNKLILVIPILLFACIIPNKKQKDSPQIDSNINKIDTVIAQGEKRYCELLTDTVKITVKLKVILFSIDSIMADVTFLNNEKKEIYLYKPILPSDTLIENTFSVWGKNYKTFKHVALNTNHKYLIGDQHLLPAIIPEIDSNSIVIIKPNQQLSFRVNIAKFYDFRQTDRKLKSREVTIGYGNLFPYIIDGKQVILPYDGLNNKCDSRVYFIVHSKNEQGKLERIKILLPSHGG